MENNMIHNSLAICTTALVILWGLLLIYKFLQIKKDVPYEKSGILIKFKFSYIFLIFLFICLVYGAIFAWHRYDRTLSVATFVSMSLIVIGVVAFLISNHFITVPEDQENIQKQYQKFKTIRLTSAVIVILLMILQSLFPYSL